MLDIGCVICSFRISEGSKTTLSADLQYIMWLHGNTRNIKHFLKLTSQQLIAN